MFEGSKEKEKIVKKEGENNPTKNQFINANNTTNYYSITLHKKCWIKKSYTQSNQQIPCKTSSNTFVIALNYKKFFNKQKFCKKTPTNYYRAVYFVHEQAKLNKNALKLKISISMKLLVCYNVRNWSLCIKYNVI